MRLEKYNDLIAYKMNSKIKCEKLQAFMKSIYIAKREAFYSYLTIYRQY